MSLITVLNCYLPWKETNYKLLHIQSIHITLHPTFIHLYFGLILMYFDIICSYLFIPSSNNLYFTIHIHGRNYRFSRYGINTLKFPLNNLSIR